MSDLIKEINKYPNGEIFFIEWPNGLHIKAELDTLYETPNDVEYGEPGYKEYWAACFRIKKILSHSEESKSLDLKEGNLYEVSMKEPPKILTLVNGNVVWEYSV